MKKEKRIQWLCLTTGAGTWI